MANQPRLKVKAFGQSNALTLEALSYGDRQGDAIHTVVFEIAKAESNGHFDWASKVVFKIDLHELPFFAGVLLGYLPHYDIQRPPNKSMSIFRQTYKDKPGHYYLKVFQDKVPYHLPITAGHGVLMANLILHQLSQHAEGHYDSEIVLASVRSACKLILSPKELISA